MNPTATVTTSNIYFPDIIDFVRYEGSIQKIIGESKKKFIILGVIALTVIAFTYAVSPLSCFLVGLTITGGVITNLYLRSIVYITNTSHENRCDNGSFDIKKTQLLENSQISFEKKKQLIIEAKKSIVLSGNYCGGQSFQEVLRLLETKLCENSEFRIVILSSPHFISEENQKLIDELESQFGERFQITITDIVWVASDSGMKKSTNHIKALVADGTKAIIGGDGLEDKYAYSRGVGDREIEIKDNQSWLSHILPRGFRDQSYYLEGKDFCRHVCSQLLHFANYWRRVYLNQEIQEINFNDFFIDEKEFFTEERVEFFVSSPEMRENWFFKRVIELIQSSKDSIDIDHMYFQPHPEFMQALVHAANRGVKIRIVTNGYEKFSPASHIAFGDLNRYGYLELINKVSPEARSNIEVFEYGQKFTNTPRKTTLHKKVIRIDDSVVFGNSNLGYKSQITMSDYEMNVITHSPKLAMSTKEIVDRDCYELREAHNSQDEPIYKDAKRVRVPLSKLIFSEGEFVKEKPNVNIFRFYYTSLFRPLCG